MASDEEAQMRAAVIAWGRVRWPGARVVHELQVGGCRIDLGFILPDNLIGIEIKSSRDTLMRLDRQMRAYTAYLPEVWLAHAPRWTPDFWDTRLPGNVGQIEVDAEVREQIPSRHGTAYPHTARCDEMITTPLLWLLLKPELVALGRAHGARILSKDTCWTITHRLARSLTGDQIVRGVCAHLRARPMGWGGDAPIPPPIAPSH